MNKSELKKLILEVLNESKPYTPHQKEIVDFATQLVKDIIRQGWITKEPKDNVIKIRDMIIERLYNGGWISEDEFNRQSDAQLPSKPGDMNLSQSTVRRMLNPR